MTSEAAFADIDALVSHLRDGDTLALPHAFTAEFSGVSMAATRTMIRRRLSGLHLVCVPSGSFQADMLIGAGCVASIQSGSVLLYEYGPAHRFAAAQKRGAVLVRDSTCPAIHAALIAGEKGLPFMPVRGIIGSDILANRRDEWRVIDNPFAVDDPIVLVPALRPDATLFHAPLADRHGNVWIGKRSELQTMARASRKALVTFEAWYEGDLFDDELLAPATIPAMYVTCLSHQPRGSWPLSGGAGAPEDAAHLRDYARLAKTDEGFADYLDRYVMAPMAAA